jgi:hypothetical protein
VALWIDGVLDVGRTEPLWWANAVWTFMSLAIIHYTRGFARRAVERFAPLVADRKEELAGIAYRMTHMPAAAVNLLSLGLLVFFVMAIRSDPGFIHPQIFSPVAYLLGGAAVIFSYSMGILMAVHLFRQLYFVTRAYALVKDVNVFHQQPLYALSDLTMRVSLFMVLILTFNYANTALYATSSSLAISATEANVNVVFSIALSVLIVLAFILPLWGIHLRLAEAKGEVMEENSMQIEGARQKLYTAISKDDFARVEGLDNATSSLYREREQLAGISTWPWAPGTLRNLLSAVFIPMLLWLLQTAFARFFS